MTVKNSGPYREELIKEALRRELDSITPPPPELMWQRIQSGMAPKNRAPVPLRRRFHWQRYSAAAAALLICLLGVLGIYRAVHAPDFSALESEGTGELMLLRTGDGDQPSWKLPGGWIPTTVPEARHFVTAGDFIAMEQQSYGAAGSELTLTAVVYSRNGENLLWIYAGPPAPERDLFLAELGKALDAELQLIGSAGDALFLEAAGRPVLAWHAGGFAQALWVLSGDVDVSDLQNVKKLIPVPGTE